jgi:hypothetical protein
MTFAPVKPTLWIARRQDFFANRLLDAELLIRDGRFSSKRNQKEMYVD